jgi:hypothetical protein
MAADEISYGPFHLEESLEVTLERSDFTED